MKKHIAFFMLTLFTVLITGQMSAKSAFAATTHAPASRESIVTDAFLTSIGGTELASDDIIDLTQLPADGDIVTIRLVGGMAERSAKSFTVIGNKDTTINDIAIVVEGYVNLTIEDLNIASALNHGSTNAAITAYSTIHCQTGTNANLKLMLKGENTITASSYSTNYGAAIGVPETAAIEISEVEEGGILNATSEYAHSSVKNIAAIGTGCGNSNAGKITVKSGTVNAKAAGALYGMIGIGGPTKAEINIEGGTVNAEGGNAPAIKGNNITISGGEVNTHCSTSGNNSGNGIYGTSNSTINITGGVVNASGDSGYSVYGIATDQNSTINILEGTINANSYASVYGYGIYVASSSTINILGGKVNISGSSSSGYTTAGIYMDNTNSKLNIKGGTVNAQGGTSGGYGIYGGSSNAVNISGGIVTASGGAKAIGNGSTDAANALKTTITGGSVSATTFDPGQPTNGEAYGSSLLERITITGDKNQTLTAIAASKSGFDNYEYTYTLNDSGRAVIWLPEFAIETSASLPEAVLSFKNPPSVTIEIMGSFMEGLKFYSEDLPEGFSLDENTGVISIDPTVAPDVTYTFNIEVEDTFGRVKEAEFTITPVVRDYEVTFVSNEGETTHIGNIYGITTFPNDPPQKEYFTFKGWYTKDGEKITADTPVEEDLTVYQKWSGNLHDMPEGSAVISVPQDEPPFKSILKLKNTTTGETAYIGVEKTPAEEE